MTPPARPAFAAAARGARRWLLWLALVIGAAHSLAAWHVYTHAPAPQAERSSKSGHAGPDACALCLAAAGIGGAPGAAPDWQPARLAQPAPASLPADERPQLAPARPYAIRAPPLLAS
jgi:hypothetical protein